MNRWERFQYRLMEEPPVDGGDPGAGADPAPDPAPSIPIDVLPEDWRNKPVAEQRFLVNHMVSTYGNLVEQTNSLKQQLADVKAKIDTPPPPAPPDPDDTKTLAELILEDPEKAIDRHLKARGYVQRFDDVSGMAGDAVISALRHEVPAFAENEDAVVSLMKQGKMPATRANVMGALKIVLGQKVLDDQLKDQRKNAGGIPPSPSPAPKKEDDEPQLSSLEKEFMAASGITDPKVWVKLRDAEVADIKIPMGR